MTTAVDRRRRLLDGNLLVALSVAEHVHHRVARSWLAATQPLIATCAITQGTLLRMLLREGLARETALATLASITERPSHEFWVEDISYLDIDLAGVVGHRQVTDAYLAALASARGGLLATADRGLAQLRPEVTELIPV